MKRLTLGTLATILLVLFGLGVVQIYAEKRAEENLKTWLKRLDIEEEATYSEVRYSLLTGSTEVRRLSIKTPQETTTVERLVVRKLTDHDLEIELYDLRSDSKEFKNLLNSMRELGYEDFKTNIKLSASLYEKDKVLLIRNFSVESPSAFRVSLKLELKGIDRDLLEELGSSEDNDREKVNRLAERLSRVSLVGGEIDVTDMGMGERLIIKEAKERGKKPSEVKEELISELSKNAKTEFEKEAVGAIKKLIERGGTLRVKIEPSSPVSFQELVVLSLMALQTKEPEPLLRRLNVRIEHIR
ncbi:hypothetical protein [Hydrogenivirga sp.]